MFIKKETKKLGQNIISDFKNWNDKPFTFSNNDEPFKFSNGHISIWIASGVFYIDFHPTANFFNIFEKFYIQRCIKTSRRKRALHKINNL
jgi:hypothetical protein